jgi:hypothetical protein
VSSVAELLDEALKEAAPASGKLALAGVQRRASRRLLQTVAMQYRRAAELVDQALELMSQPKEGTDAET